MSADPGARATTISTGGGGVVLELQYGAMLIAALLTGDQLPELGDRATPLSVRFQALEYRPVDDFLVVGRTPDGAERRVSIGVRRAPKFAGRDRKTARLLAGYVRVVGRHWDEVREGRWRLALVTASRSTATTEVSDLTQAARAAGSEQKFRHDVAQPHGKRKELRGRLRHVDELVRVAAAEAGTEPAAVEVEELTWRLLSSLFVREVRLAPEGDTTDRTATVNRLRGATRDRTPEAADALFARLYELSGRYGPAGALVTRESLSRDLSGVPLAGSPAPLVASVLVAGSRAVPQGEAPLTVRWRAGEEGRLGDRRYLLLQDRAGLLREGRDPSGQHMRRQALARQTDPAPAAGRTYAWLRQGGNDLTRERDLLMRALSPPDATRTRGRQARLLRDGRPAAGLPEVTYFDTEADTITLAISWPADKDGLPCHTVRERFAPGALDPWRLSLLLAGLHSLTFPLQQLHCLGVSHRNLEPEAIIVGSRDFILRDLGLASAEYRAGEGPASYQAPEQTFGARMPRPGPPTDVYQLAAIAYHLITGRVPGPGAPPARHPALPAGATGIISAALAARPADRPGWREFRAALQQTPRPRPEGKPPAV